MLVRRRPLLRAAAVGGTAYLAGKRVARRHAEEQYLEDDQYARINALEQEQAAARRPPSAQPNGAQEDSIADQLSQLIRLHRQGDLTDAEFAAAKAGVLGSPA